MNKENTSLTYSGLTKNNRVLRLGFLGMMLLVIIETFGLVFRSQIITIVPSNVMTKATYTATSADEGALSSWGLYLATLMGNVTPSNADFTAETIGHLLSPGIYKDVMAGIENQVKHIKEDQLTLSYAAAEVKCNTSKNVVYVDGWLTSTDSHGTSTKEERTYEIYFSVANYQPVVVGLTSYTGKPHMGQ